MTISSLRLRLPSAALSFAWWTRLRDFFAYHGVWAIGVRLLRAMSIRDKVLLVMGIIVAPLLPLTAKVVMDQNATVAATSQRLAGLRLAGAASALGVALRASPTAVAIGPRPPATDKLAPALAALDAAQAAALQAGLPVQQAWERDRQAVERAVQAADLSNPARLDLIDAGVAALADFREVVVAGASVAASADPDLHDSGSLALEDLPALQVSMGSLWRRVQQQLAHDGRMSELERQAVLIDEATGVADVGRMAGLAEHRLRAMRHDRAAVNLLLPAVQAYLEAVKTQLLVHEPAPDAPTLSATYGAAWREVQDLRLEQLSRAEQSLLRQQADARRLRAWIFGLLLLTIVVSQYLLYCFFLVMRGGLVQLNLQMTRMSQGDLSARLAPLGGDEVAATMQAMTAALVRLSDLLASVRQGVGAVTQASQQVALGNADLSRRDHEAALNVAAVVDGVARNAAQLEACGRQVEAVVNTVQALRLESARNRKQMQRLRERMSSLSSKSREIGEVVALIDTVAFRTNILALNASVEASKAGEAGRGFAVVAQEVRSLAQRSADSARRIGEIVARSSEDIEHSGALAEETGRALALADAHVDQIHLAMDDVAALTRNGEKESTTILEQLTSIKDGGAQNLKLVEQLAAASDALRSQGERLAHRVGQFRLS
jgi:methyl-accepting chemotaxis protein